MASNRFATLPGGLAKSKPRLSNLRDGLGASSVCAVHIHFLDLLRPLDSWTTTVLDKLLPFPGTFELAYEDVNQNLPDLDEGETAARWQNIVETVSSSGEKNADDVFFYYITPRAGTISPWSSQATAQAHVCGLEQSVKRIERGTVYAVTFQDKTQAWNGEGQPPSWTENLFDRMTQSIGTKFPDLSAIFGEQSPKSAQSIKIRSNDGSVSKDALQSYNKEAGLALDVSEIDYLVEAYGKLGRDPTNVELFMFAQGEPGKTQRV